MEHHKLAKTAYEVEQLELKRKVAQLAVAVEICPVTRR